MSARRGAQTAAQQIWRLPQVAMIGFIRVWRAVLSPLYGPTCKYYPSCSAYGLEAVTVHGAVRGGLLTGWRVLRCNPLSQGGVDDVPPRRASRGPQGEDAHRAVAPGRVAPRLGWVSVSEATPSQAKPLIFDSAGTSLARTRLEATPDRVA